MTQTSYFKLGWITVALTVGMPFLYFIARSARRLQAWLNRDAPPKERVGAYLVIAVVLGFICGGLLQAQWDGLSECRAQGYNGARCLMMGLASPAKA